MATTLNQTQSNTAMIDTTKGLARQAIEYGLMNLIGGNEVFINTLDKPLKTNQDLNDFLKSVSENLPDLKDLPMEAMQTIIKMALFDRYKDEARQRIELNKIDYIRERDNFIATASKTSSRHTQIAYKNAMIKLELFCNTIGIRPLELTPAQADDFINNLRQLYSPATVRQIVAGCSTFYSYIERRYNCTGKLTFLNSFRGTRQRPAQRPSNARTFQVPTEAEVNTIIDNLPKPMATIAYISAHKGLRAGAYENLKIWGTRFSTISKGKEYKGEFTQDILDKINELPKDAIKKDANFIHSNFIYHTKKLYKQGKISAVFSIHDLRHFFAINEYKRDKDIYKLQKELNHASISITERYLKGLNLID